MGLNISSIKYLQLMKEKFQVDFSNMAMLGRQDLVVSDSELQKFCNLIGYKDSVETVKEKDGFSENMFTHLFHSRRIDSFDYCDYEGATVSLDLNEAIPDTYIEQYDIVLDGGTLEHIFNYPIALKNAMCMCKKGGYLVLMTPSNNYNGHGFYQFSPDLFWDVLSNNGFDVCDTSYIEECGNEIYVPYRVNEINESRLNTKIRAGLYVCAKKNGQTPDKLISQQSKWEIRWGGVYIIAA